MKTLLIACLSLFSFVEADNVPQEKKESIVMVAQPETKNIFGALIDGKPYLVEASDIQLLEEIMENVAIRGKKIERVSRTEEAVSRTNPKCDGSICR